MNTQTIRTFAAIFLGTGTLLAQDIGHEARSITDSAHGIWRDGGAVHARGAYYAAEFRDGTFSFTPALGLRASRDYPARFALESIRRAGAEFTALNDTEAQVDRDLVSFARGPHAIERYEVRADGVEQSFVFPNRIHGDGDLVVRLRLDTDLSSDFRGVTETGLILAAEGLGGISIGSVTGIDANGAKRRGSLRYDGTYLELVLPGDFVDQARYPLVLDPLIATQFFVDRNGGDDDDPDVVYESTTDEFLIVWARAFSQARSEILGQRIDGSTYSPIGGAFPIGGAIINLKPAVATVASRNQFLVTWQASISLLGPFDLRLRGVEAGTGTLSRTQVFGTPANETDPDISGDRTTLRDAIVTWATDDDQILAAKVALTSPTGTPSVSASSLIANGGGALVSRPAISKSGGDARRWLITWDWNGASASPAVFGRVIDRNLTRIGPQLSIAVVSNLSEGSADCDGDGNNFLVAWSETESGLVGDRDVYCRRVTATATSATLPGTKVPVRAVPNQDQWDPAVAFLGPKFLVTWTQETSGFLSTGIRGLALDPSNCDACGQRFQFGTGGQRQVNSEVGSKYAGGANGDDDSLVVCASYQQTLPFDGSILAVPFGAVGPGGAVTSVAASCGGGGTCAVSGAFAFANTVGIDLTGAESGATLAALHIGDAVTPLSPCGSCSILTPFVVVPVPISGGRASFELPIGCQIGLAGRSLRFEYVVGLTSTMPCLGLPVGLSNVVDAVFGF